MCTYQHILQWCLIAQLVEYMCVVCVCVCVWIYMYVCMYVCVIYVYIPTYTTEVFNCWIFWVCICYMYVCVPTYTYMCIFARVLYGHIHTYTAVILIAWSVEYVYVARVYVYGCVYVFARYICAHICAVDSTFSWLIYRVVNVFTIFFFFEYVCVVCALHMCAYMCTHIHMVFTCLIHA